MMKKLYTMMLVIIGVVMRLVGSVVPTSHKLWIFGAQDGQGFVDNSKYLFLEVTKRRQGVQAIWITRNREVLRQITAQGGRVYHNLSLRGLVVILRAERYFFSTTRGDILFCHKKPGRHYHNLWHGMPVKKIIYDYRGRDVLKGNPVVYAIWEELVVGFKHSDVDFVIATSPFYQDILASAFRTQNVVVTGLPRNDIFGKYNKDELLVKYKLARQTYVITYLPTHRKYGKGQANPIPFLHNIAALRFFSDNNIAFLVKHHRSMQAALEKLVGDEVLNEDLPVRVLPTDSGDVQELLEMSDCLVTDYSSCFVDFLLLDRPIVFYLYDEYDIEDNELYFDLEDYPIGEIVRNEIHLFEVLKSIRQSGDSMTLKRRAEFKRFHSHNDRSSAKRIIEHVLKTSA